MIFLYAFLIGGTICLIAQLCLDVLKLLPVQTVVLFVVLGSLFEAFGLYDKLVDFAGAGAMLPISSFGHSLTHSAVAAATQEGVLGLFSGIFDLTSSGIAAAGRVWTTSATRACTRIPTVGSPTPPAPTAPPSPSISSWSA